MRARSLAAWMLLAFTCLISTNSVASETTTYSYDALGRLVQVSNTGTINNGLTSSYNYDPAGNRSNVAVAGGGVIFSISDVSGTEGATLQFTVTKSGSTSDSFTVNYTTANGTATAGSDYNSVTNSLVFGPADTQKTITVTTIDDVAYEGNETFYVNLSGAVGATISDAQGIGTILDNETPPPSFAINDVSVTEGGNLVLTVTKTGTTSSSFSVNYASANGTATAGSDYTAVSGTLTFAAADVTKTITIATTNDVTVESAETVLVNLSGATGGATITDTQGIGTINDNDETPPSFSINDVSITEGGNLVLTVTKNATKSNSYSVSYATSNGTATAGSDYTATSGTLTFAGADLTKTITVATINDTAIESAETVLVNLSSPTGGSTITDSQGVGTINDNDNETPPSFAINHVSGNEGTTLTFTITKTGTVSGTYTVNYATANGNAIAGTHYYSKSGTLSFGPSDTTKTVGVITIQDFVYGATRYFYVDLSSPSGGATITTSRGQGAIINIDEEDPCPLCLMAPAPPETESTSDPASGVQEGDPPPEASEPGQLSYAGGRR